MTQPEQFQEAGGVAEPEVRTDAPNAPESLEDASDGDTTPDVAHEGSGSKGPWWRRVLGGMWRWARRLMVVLVVVLVTLALGVAWLTQTPSGRSFVAKQVTRVVSDHVLMGDLTIERIDGPIFGRVSVHGIVLTDAQGVEAVRVSEVHVAYRIRPLLRSSVVVDELRIVDPHVRGVVLMDGDLNLAGLLQPSDSDAVDEESDGPGWSVSIPTIRVEGGRYVMLDRRNDDARLVVVEDLEVDAAFELSADGAMDVTVDRMMSRVGTPIALDLPFALGVESLTLALEGERMAVAVAKILVGDTQLLGLTGEIMLDPSGEEMFEYVDLAFPDVTLDPSTINDLELGVNVLVPIEIRGSITGPPESVTADVTLAALESTVSVGITLDLRDPAYLGYGGSLEIVRLQPHLWVDLDDITADISMGVQFDGRGITPDDAEGNLQVDIGPSRLMGYAVEDTYLSIRYADGEVVVPTLRASLMGVELAARARATLDGSFDLNTRATIVDLRVIHDLVPDLPPVAGRLSVTTNITAEVPPERWSPLMEGDPIDAGIELLSYLQAQVTVQGSSLSFDGNRVETLALSLDVPPASDPAGTLEVTVDGVDIPGVVALRSASVVARLQSDVLSMTVEVVERSGTQRGRFQGSATYQGGTLRVNFEELVARVDALELRLREYAQVRVRFDDDFEFVDVYVPVLALALNDLPFEVSAEYAASGRFYGRFFAAALDLGVASQLVPDAPTVGGTARILAVANGTLANPELALDLALTDVSFEAFDAIHATLVLGYRVGRLSLRSSLQIADQPLLDVDTGEVGIPVRINLETGRYRVESRSPMELNVTVAEMEISEVVDLLPDVDTMGARGEITGSMQLAGSLYEPEVEAHFSLLGFGANLPMPDGSLWELRDVDVVGGALYGWSSRDNLNAKVDIRWQDQPFFSTTIAATADWDELISGEMDVETWARQLEGTIRAVLSPLDLNRLPEAILRDAGVNGGVANARLHWTGGIAQGSLRLRAALDELDMEGLPLTSVQAIVESESDTRVDIRVATGDVSPMQEWQSIPGFARHFPAVGDAPILKYPDTGIIRVLVEHHQGYQSLARDGVNLDAPLAARLHVPSLPLSALGLEDDTMDIFRGGLRGYVDVTGSLLRPEAIGRFTLRDLDFADGSTGLVGLELSYADREVDVRAFICSADGETLQIEANAQLPHELLAPDGSVRPLDFASLPFQAGVIARTVPLAAVLPTVFVGTLVEDVEGWLDVQMVAHGTLEDPRFSGTVGVVRASLGVIPLGRSLDRIDVLVALSNESVEIELFEIRDGAGRMSADGRIDLVDFLPRMMNVNLSFDQFFVSDPSGLGAFVDGKVGIVGRTRADDIMDIGVTLTDITVTLPDDLDASSAGPVALASDVYFIGEDIDRDQVGRRVPRRLGVEEEEVFETGAFLADIRIRTVGDNKVSMAIADVGFRIEMLVRLRDDEFALSGEVELTSGRVTVVGKTFDVTRGFVLFDGQPNSVNPVIDVRAVHILPPGVASRLESPSGDRASVTVVVDGRLDELTDANSEAIRLQSDPDMTSEDIIYVLLTGRPREESDVGADQQALATAGALALNVLGDRLASQTTAIDTIRIEGDSQTGQALSRVEGGKYISEDLYVSSTFINSQDREDNNFEFALEWIMVRFRSASIRGELRGGDRGKGGIELLYSLTRRGRIHPRVVREREQDRANQLFQTP